MTRFDAATFALAAALAAGTIAPAFAQNASVPGRSGAAAAPAEATPPASAAQQPVVVYQNSVSAQDVRRDLNEVLNHYPPTLRQLLRLDPTLLNRSDYVSTYPQLAAFIQQHPEVARNPTFFFGEPDFPSQRTPRDHVIDVVHNTLDGIGFLAGFLTVVSLVYLLLRQALEYRRWRRQIQIQTEVHTKLLDRMTNNQELLAYMETPAGRRFLETPMSVAPMAAAAPPTLAPMTRILWSVQIGVVVVALGIGFWIAQANISDADLSSVFEVMGSLAIAVGVGFVVSALLSWALSLRMGLISAPAVKAE
ncbi:MAG TPA: hypothetical protein VL173_10450 [Vicinamibacterales bacterium]|jgi:hypothetical protein|nr:hypothetical protein [Vicinamibacterales bacterium]